MELAPDPVTGAPVWTKYPHPDFKRVGTGAAAKTFFHHRDHLKSNRLITDAASNQTRRTTYFACGEKGLESAVAGHREEKGYIGENQDAETGLLYLHAPTTTLPSAASSLPRWDPHKPGVAPTDMAILTMILLTHQTRMGIMG